MRNDELDLNKIAAEAGVAFTKDIFSSAKLGIKSLLDKQMIKYDAGVQNYIEYFFERHSKIKNLIYKDNSKNLFNHYISVKLKNEDDVSTDLELVENFTNQSRILVSGVAGSGKSLLMRRIALELIVKKKSFIPIIVELREWNSSDSQTLLDLSLRSLSEGGLKIEKATLEYALSIGKFCLICDGFDEISPKLSAKVYREIIEFIRKNPLVPFIMTSRPEHPFGTESSFKIYNLLPLGKKDALELISTLEIEKDARDKFFTAIERDLYDKFTDFASNPLLLTMMFLVFVSNGKISDKKTSFYEEAFEVLFRKHDSINKNIFVRDFNSKNIGREEFIKILANICFDSYFNFEYDFTEFKMR
jgi:predicted NACHT family NTPase